MKVKKLISELKKLLQDLEVYWADHDHGRYETNNIAGDVLLIDKSEMNEIENDDDEDNHGCFKHTLKQYVCIRP